MLCFLKFPKLKTSISNQYFSHIFGSCKIIYFTVTIICQSSVLANADIVPSFSETFETIVSKDGSMSLPKVDFRADWTMLGAWSIDGEEGAEGMHVVYTQPNVAKVFRNSGTFPDGAVLVKELLDTKTDSMTTGTVSWGTDPSGWFMMVKDSQNRFPDNQLWGNGWGWSFFKSDNREVATTKNYKFECKSCHIPAKNTDWIYIQGYPVLKK